MSLKQGRTYLREVSYDGKAFELPHKLGSDRFTGLIAWSRILSDNETLVIINCNMENDQSAFISIDNSLHEVGDDFKSLYMSFTDSKLQTYEVHQKDNRKCLYVEVPKYGCVICSNK